MSEMKHMPGPWRWSRSYEMGRGHKHWCLENDESAAAGMTIDASLVLLHGDDSYLGVPFLSNPNARLIAAAPDLYAALWDILRLDIDNQIPNEVWQRAHAAIEKATGEKS